MSGDDDESVDWNSGDVVGEVSGGSAFAPTRPVAMAELALDSEASMGEGILPSALLSPVSIRSFKVSLSSDMTTDADVSFGDASADAAAGRGGGGSLAVDTPCRFFKCLVRSPAGTQKP